MKTTQNIITPHMQDKEHDIPQFCNLELPWSSHSVTTVEPHLSNSRLSVPSIIWNDVHKFLKQVISNCWARDQLFVV